MTSSEMITDIEAVLQDEIPSDAMSNHDVQRLAVRVAGKLAHLAIDHDETKQLRNHIADHRAACSYSCSIIERVIGAKP